MAASTLDKFIWLIDLIERKGHISFADIASNWLEANINDLHEPLALRTFNRWKHAIFDQFRLKIVCNRSTNEYSLENISNLKNGDVRKWLLDALSVSNMLDERDALEGRILLEDVPSGRKYLQPIISAMKENHKLDIVYQDFTDSTTYTVTLAPYCVKVFERRWNVVGKIAGKRELERFSLDRIQDIKVLDATFAMPKNFDAASYFSDCYGVARYDFYGHLPAPTRIVIRVDSIQRDYVRTLRLHHSQKEIATTDEYSDFELYLRPTYDFIQFILTLNFRTQIIAPSELRQTMAKIAVLMAENYQDCYDDIFEE